MPRHRAFGAPLPSVLPEEAEARADRLLRAHLTPAQRRQLDAHEAFAVTGSRGGRYVVVRRPVAHSVVSVEERAALGYSPYLAGGLPRSDAVLATALAIEADETDVLDNACRSPLPPVWAVSSEDGLAWLTAVRAVMGESGRRSRWRW